MTKPTAQELRALLKYSPDTGEFVWRVRRASRALFGQRAGHVARDGYVRIGINRDNFPAHSLAWLYVHGSWPETQIDHIDGNRANNSFANLRLATPSQNQWNKMRGPLGKSGVRGVLICTRRGRKRFKSRIKVSNKIIWLGTFDTSDEAAAAYRAATFKYHGEFSRFSRPGVLAGTGTL